MNYIKITYFSSQNLNSQKEKISILLGWFSTSVVLDLDSYDLKCVFEPIMKDCLNTSFIAKDTINNKIAGAIICNDYNYFLNLDGHSNQKSEPVGSLLT